MGINNPGVPLSRQVIAGTGLTGGGPLSSDVTLNASASGGGGLVLLEQDTAANSADLTLTNFLSADYDDYLIELIGVVASQVSQSLNFRASIDNGATWISTASYMFRLDFLNPAGVSSNSSGLGPGSSTSISMNGSSLASTAPAAGYSGSFHLFNPGSTTRYKNMLGRAAYDISYIEYMNWVGKINTTSPVNGLKFYMSSSNIDVGTVRIYGLEK